MVALKRNNLVICSVNEVQIDVAGQCVGSVRQSLVDVLNVGRYHVAFVRGQLVDEDYRLRSGDVLLFMLLWGRKSGKKRIDVGRYVPAGAPEWVNETLIRHTLDTYQPYYEHQLTCEDALDIIMNISRYWEVVKEWQKP